MSRKKVLASAVAVLVLVFSASGRAEDEDEGELEAAPVTPTSPSLVSPGVTPDSSLVHDHGAPGSQYAAPMVAPGTMATGPSTTHLTGALYEPDREADRLERDRRGPNRVMLINGTAIFLGTYAVSAVAGGVSDTTGNENLLIPVAGPWLALAERDCGAGGCGFGDDVELAHIIGSGVAQAAGLGLIAGSFLLGEPSAGRPRERRDAKVQVLPMNIGRGGAGLGAFGSF